MDRTDIESSYRRIAQYYEKYLKESGVKLPKLYHCGSFGMGALILVKLFEGYPNTKIHSKEELSEFLREHGVPSKDMQQARHLAMQNGFYILSGRRGDISDEKILDGCYKLVTLEQPYPAFCPERREGYKGDFEAIKKEYCYRCATCGSKEGEEHLFRHGVKVELQEGHMDPTKPLTEGNIIPQCQICNRPDRNKWIFDITGRVVDVAPTEDGTRIVKEFLKNATPEIRKEILEFIKSL